MRGNEVTRRALLAGAGCWLALPRPAAAQGVRSIARSIAGDFLIAKPRMPDPRFRESVLVMCRHAPDGAFGLICNKPMAEVPLADLMRQFLIEDAPGAAAPSHVAVHYGGPVEPQRGFLLHSTDWVEDGTWRVTKQIAMSANRSAIVALARGEGPRHYLFCIGYAGWGPGQIEGEFGRGDWETAPAEAALTFDRKHESKWERARKGAVDL
ncbi:MAG: YqgE/AlgH family protein [Alphaproteobacteria bacterium]|nr:YqgE/AlgH family protein [Alphaproteobacteria bacterium]